MDRNSKVCLLRIYISNTDKFKHTPLSDAIVHAARRYGISGATVLKGIMGYGSSGIIKSAKFWEFTEKIPIVVEIIDEKEKIKSFVENIKPFFEKVKSGYLITIEEIEIILHHTGKKKQWYD